jgi:hypothetical protein
MNFFSFTIPMCWGVKSDYLYIELCQCLHKMEKISGGGGKTVQDQDADAPSFIPTPTLTSVARLRPFQCFCLSKYGR